MKRTVPLAMIIVALGSTSLASAQRYTSEIFTNAQLTFTPDVIYGTNIDFLTSNFSSPLVPADITTLQTAVQTGNPIPASYFDPSDPSTAVKVTNVRMDIYEPSQGIDAVTARPLVVYVHTGNALSPPLNGSPTGTRKDSSAVEICSRMARRGYVAVSMSYRLGWNPLGATLEIRRGTLLNAIYRAIHDVRQCVRSLKSDAAGANTYAIDPNKIVVLGEGTGGYIALGNATLDQGSELFIEKFVPDPLNFPDVSYVDTTQVGNLEGFNAPLTLYQPNGFDHTTNFCVNLGGALADTSWLAPGDVPMVAFHTVFDPFAPFTEGIVIVPTTGEQVVPVQGSNLFMQLVNTYGNNSSFVNLPDGNPFTDRARATYGTTFTHGTTSVTVNTGTEGLFPLIRPFWPSPAMEEASPWQFWDPNGALAQTVIIPGPPPVTAGQAASASNPDMSPTKARTYIDTIMGYMNPRIVCALQLGPCSLVGMEENAAATGVSVYPNPASDHFTVSGGAAMIQRFEIFDVNGRLVRSTDVNAKQAVIAREGLRAGAYMVQLHFADGTAMRKLLLD